MAALFSSYAFPAQKTIITGIAPGAERKTIRLTTPGDLITWVEKPLASSKVDSMGSFSLSVNLDKPTFVFISIDFHKTELILEPGKKYELEIAPAVVIESAEINPLIESQNLVVSRKNVDPLDLNLLIGEFDSIYSAFLMKNFNALNLRHNKVVLDTFRISVNQRFGDRKEPYFVDWVLYKIASLEQLSQYYSQSQLATKYFSEKPVLYNNLEYMEFFNSYFSKYLTATSNVIRKIDLRPVLKSPDPRKAMMKVMEADTLLKGPQLRELVMLKGLLDIYPLEAYDKPDILKVITLTGEQSLFPENKEVARNMYTFLTNLKPGSRAPAFKLPNRDKKEISLESLKGKPVVLCFWTTYCESCLAELDLIKPIYDTFKDRVQFVSISADRYATKMNLFINLKRDWVWTFLHIGDQLEVLVDYDVRTYPLFVLIDKEGKIYRYPSKLPSSGLEEDLQTILK